MKSVKSDIRLLTILDGVASLNTLTGTMVSANTAPSPCTTTLRSLVALSNFRTIPENLLSDNALDIDNLDASASDISLAYILTKSHTILYSEINANVLFAVNGFLTTVSIFSV